MATKSEIRTIRVNAWIKKHQNSIVVLREKPVTKGYLFAFSFSQQKWIARRALGI